MINEKMQDALNDQINAEMYSSYLYLSMSAYFAGMNLNGFANWMRIQAQEELAHAIKFFDYIDERGGKVELKAIDSPPSQWDSPLSVFEEVYKHEQLVTSLINKLVYLAVDLKDRATESFLQWYVNEQVEEESNADDIVQQLKLIGDTGPVLFMFDRELQQRTFVNPLTTTGA